MTGEIPEQGPLDPEPPATDPSPPPPGPGATADVAIRFAARLIDGLLVGFVTSVLYVPFLLGNVMSQGRGFDPMGFGTSSFFVSLALAILVIGYFVLMESQTGQTVGKMAVGIRTQGPGGGDPTVEQALKRNAWLALSIVPVVGGLAQLALMIYIAVTINSSPTDTGWHDEFAGGTTVIRIR